MLSQFDLTGKKNLVTGGTRGLGWSMAEGLMEAGAEVVIWGSTAKVEDVAQAFRQRGLACHGVAADLADRASLEDGFRRSLALLGGDIDILASDASAYLSDAVIPVDGGYLGC
ncbi:MAG: SDR family NAD(P)-dependent oxidoreductase [Clostridiales bacterium]|nr:SDR family NAD(P)-dependent oxidoreductase [Clostridiales bacterium]